MNLINFRESGRGGYQMDFAFQCRKYSADIINKMYLHKPPALFNLPAYYHFEDQLILNFKNETHE